VLSSNQHGVGFSSDGKPIALQTVQEQIPNRMSVTLIDLELSKLLDLQGANSDNAEEFQKDHRRTDNPNLLQWGGDLCGWERTTLYSWK
jgi:hypothetical protein